MATGIDPVSLIAFDKVVMTADAVKRRRCRYDREERSLKGAPRAPHVSEKASTAMEKLTPSFSSC